MGEGPLPPVARPAPPVPRPPCAPQALALEPTHLKALVRRAAARLELGQAQEALQVGVGLDYPPRP